MILVVTAIPGREALTMQTLAALDERGGATSLGGRRVLFWTSMLPPPKRDGWVSMWLPRVPMGAKADFWWMLNHAPAGDDLFIVEDDVEPCTNLVPYVERWRTPPDAAFTTFFNGRRLEEGVHPPMAPDGRGFWFSQAMKLPAWFVESAAGTDVSPGIYSSGQDVALGVCARNLGLGVYYHRSLVQHIGAASVGTPGATLTGKRAPAADFVGADFDALELLG